MMHLSMGSTSLIERFFFFQQKPYWLAGWALLSFLFCGELLAAAEREAPLLVALGGEAKLEPSGLEAVRLAPQERREQYAKKRNEREYEKPASVSQEVWETLEPHFLPYHCSLRKELDALFRKRRAISSPQAVLRAGFTSNEVGKVSHAIVTTHKAMAGYMFKFFTDLEPRVEWPQLLRRVEGAKSVAAAIRRHSYESHFCVPRKWIYPLPPDALPAKPTRLAKQFILVSEEMDIYPRKQNYRHWRETMTQERLLALYTILQEEGLADSPLAFNIPFCTDGRIAFIDLEQHHRWPVPFYKLLRYLNPEMGRYWQQLTHSFAPKT